MQDIVDDKVKHGHVEEEGQPWKYIYPWILGILRYSGQLNPPPKSISS